MKFNTYSQKWWKNKVIEKELYFNSKRILLLKLDEDYEIEEIGQKNLLAIDESDSIIWIAKLPTEVYDSYYDIWLENEILYARSSNSHIAEINPNTGKIVKKYMVK